MRKIEGEMFDPNFLFQGDCVHLAFPKEKAQKLKLEKMLSYDQKCK